MITLNTAVAYQLKSLKADIDKLIAEGHTKEKCYLYGVKTVYGGMQTDSVRGGMDIVMNGRLKLPSVGWIVRPAFPLIFDRLLAQENIRMFGETGVLNEVELHAQAEVKWETYTKRYRSKPVYWEIWL